MTTISLNIIALNEAELLPRALANWRDLADELIVVIDSRTTDNTGEIVREYGGITLEWQYEHPGHKGKMRNMAIEASSGEIIVVQDADEIIQDKAWLRQFLLSEAGMQYDCLNVRFENYAEDGKVSLSWIQPRIFNPRLWKYIHAEHELPQPTDDEPRSIGTVAVLVEHRPPPDRAAPKVGPMLERLELDVQEHPGDLHPLYFLARQYVTAQMWDKGIEANERYIREAKAHLPARMMTPDAYQHLSMAQEGAGNIDAAFESQFAAISYEPHRRAFWVRLASMTRHFLGDHALALAYMHVALSVGPKGRESSASEDARLLAMLNHSLEQVHG